MKFEFDFDDFWLRFQLSQIEAAGFAAFHGRPVEAERLRCIAGYGGVFALGEDYPNKYCS